MKNIEYIVGSEKIALDFFKNLNEKDKIGIITHNDIDGIASAVVLDKVIGNFEAVKFTGYRKGMFDSYLSEFKRKKINKTIITDIDVHSEEETLKKMEKFSDILIIDHHLLRKDLNSNKIKFINTSYKHPAAYTCYDICSKITGIPFWLAGLGTASDRLDLYNEKNIFQVFDDFDFGKINEEEKGFFWKRIMDLNYSIIYFNGKEKKIFDSMKGMKELRELDIFEKYSSKIEGEINYYYYYNFNKNAEKVDDLNFYYYAPKYNINNILINKMSCEDGNKNKTYVFVSTIKNKDLLRISARRQDRKVNCPDLLKNSIIGIPNSEAGGHFVAAGGSIPGKYLNSFKRKLFEEYQKLEK